VAAQALDESAHRSVVLKRYRFLVRPAATGSHHAIRCEHFDLSTQWIFDELLEWPEGGVLLVRPVHVASVATDGSQITDRGILLDACWAQHEWRDSRRTPLARHRDAFFVNRSIRHGCGTALARMDVSLEAFPREVSAQCSPSIVSSPFSAAVVGRLLGQAAGRLGAAAHRPGASSAYANCFQR